MQRRLIWFFFFFLFLLKKVNIYRYNRETPTKLEKKKKKKGKQLTHSILIKVRCCALPLGALLVPGNAAQEPGQRRLGLQFVHLTWSPAPPALPGNGLAKPPRSALRHLIKIPHPGAVYDGSANLRVVLFVFPLVLFPPSPMCCTQSVRHHMGCCS